MEFDEVFRSKWVDGNKTQYALQYIHLKKKKML